MIAPSLFRVALDAIWGSKLRSSLTFVGIVFGVTSVMTIISALEGIQGAIEEDLSALGPSTFMVSKMMMVTSEEMFWEKVKRKPILLADVKIIEEGCSDCDKVSPRAFTSASVKYGNNSLRKIGVMGATSSFIDIVDFEVAVGRFHTNEDDLYRRKVVFIGDMVREELFAGVDPIGKTLKLNGTKYRVIGIAKKQGDFFGSSRDNFVVIPLKCFVSQFGQPRRGINVVVRAKSVDVLDEAMDEVRLMLRSKRKVPYDKPDDFDMMTADGILDMLNSITQMFRFALVGISTISLVVGGIVVMNIMMVSVSERTREIGVRKSLGAKKNHILLQFLFESTLLTFSGGLVGIILGFLIAKSLVSVIGMEIAPSLLAISFGFGISTGIGLIFGIYPAMRAARLDPVRALSYE